MPIFCPDPNPTYDDPAFTDATVRDRVLKARAEAVTREYRSGKSTADCERFVKGLLRATAQEADRYARERLVLDARR